MVCISSKPRDSKTVIRKTARFAAYYKCKMVCAVCSNSKEDGDKLAAAQRHLINNFKLATELGAEVIKQNKNNIAQRIIEKQKKKYYYYLHWQTAFNLFNVIFGTAV